ncbi:MAG TPA: 5-formyltetrahydrofolate cyclo-ligase [Dongiaceae bacterium]|nr:5-formyltetrahydrofolate cyclo-ligase [Dongiaceae bacterium]
MPTDRPAPASSFDAAKRALRAEAGARRRAAVPALADAGIGLRDNFLAALRLPAGLAVSGYWPLSDEIDPRPLIHRLHGAGHPIGLPAVLGRGLPLAFRRWQPGLDLEIGTFGVLTPPLGAPEIVPALLLVPLLAFDRAGYRLGYGGGFYDRTLAGLRAGTEITAVGVAFALQEVPAVPRDATDQPLDWIVTEREAIRIG